MDKKRKTIITVIALALILLAVAGSYAFFVANVNNDNRMEAEIKTANVSLRFADNDGGISASLDFGKSITKEFLIENNSSAEAVVDMYWKNLTNTYLEQSLTYKLEYKTSVDSTEYINVPVSSPNVPRSENPTNGLLAEGLTVPASTTYYYRLTITLEHLDEVDQTQDFNAKLSTWFDLKDGIKPEDKPNTLQVVGSYNYTGEMWEHKQNITKLIFEDTMNAPTTYAYSYDISSIKDSSVMAYLVEDETDSTKYIAHIQAKGQIYANPDSSYLFYDFTNLKSVEGLENFITSKVTNMAYMFGYCKNLITLDLSNFNTSKVITMQRIFYQCMAITTLNVSNFNTSNVTDMSYMFANCMGLTSLDLSGFDTNKVTDMSGMFYCCNLPSINVSKFVTDRVTNMRSMFGGCYKITKLDISNFNTSNVTNMAYMFVNCSELTTLDLSSFDTSNVADMNHMFSDSKFTTLDLSSFDTSNVADMNHMFSDSKFTTLDLSGFDTSNVTNMSWMFRNCSNLTTLDLSNFNTSNVTDMSYMFANCSDLTTLNLLNWNISSVNSKNYMFSVVPSSIIITVSNTSMRTWIINVSENPKFTTSNFTVKT